MPRALKPLLIRPPFLGKMSKTAFLDQPKGTLYDVRDFWPIDAKTGRDRLAIRPGFAAFGSQAAVNLIHVLNVAADENRAATTSRRQLMIAKDGELYKNTGTGTTFTQVGSANIIDTGRNVQAASYLNRLYVANVTNEPVYYDYMDDTVSGFSGSEGTVPGSGGPTTNRCSLVATWNHRLVLAGAENHPHVVNFSRIDNPDDWDFGKTDSGSALAVPDINEPVTALVVHNRECLVVGTYNSLWIFRGDPSEGVLERLSAVVGPINATAWCKDPHDVVYMLTRKGLYRMDGGCGAPPVPISEGIIPESLLGLDGVNDVAYLEYDTRFRMVHIYIQATTPQYFHYFPDTNSFWPVTAPGTTIRAIGRYDLLDTADKSGVLIGASANLVRLDRTTALGGASAAYAYFTFPLAPLGQKAMVHSADLVFGQNTDDTAAIIEFYGAESAEDVVAQPVSRKFATTYAAISANHNHCHPRIGGQFGLLDITQVSTSAHISFEHGLLGLKSIGKER